MEVSVNICTGICDVLYMRLLTKQPKLWNSVNPLSFLINIHFDCLLIVPLKNINPSSENLEGFIVFVWWTRRDSNSRPNMEQIMLSTCLSAI